MNKKLCDTLIKHDEILYQCVTYHKFKFKLNVQCSMLSPSDTFVIIEKSKSAMVNDMLCDIFSKSDSLVMSMKLVILKMSFWLVF